MTIELAANVERQLRELAMSQRREIGALVEEAIRQYLEGEAITDLTAAEIADTQLALAAELPAVPAWSKGRE